MWYANSYCNGAGTSSTFVNVVMRIDLSRHRKKTTPYPAAPTRMPLKVKNHAFARSLAAVGP
jgi:hypothetical protein